MKKRIRRDKKGRFARISVTLKGTATAAVCYGVLIGGLTLMKEYHRSDTFTLQAEPAQAASSEIFPIGEETEYDPCDLADVVCQEELPVPTNEVERLIVETFGADAKTALAVAKAESGMNSNAQGWNCRYGGVSMACKPEDRGKAWSVDCGIYQVNHPGQACPKELLDITTNIKHAKEMYDRRGWSPWVAYTSGKYKQFID